MPSYLRYTMNSRAYSFPPCIDSIESSIEANLPDINEEPFAHFLTPVYEEDDPYALSLSAGIVVPDGPRASRTSQFISNATQKWTRYVKNNHTNLHDRYHDNALEEEEEEESFMQLDDARLNDRPAASPPRITVAEPTRGRAQELLQRKTRSRRRHRHSWREPSPELFTVEESEEDELPVLRRTKTKKSKDRRSSRSRMRGEVAEKSRL